MQSDAADLRGYMRVSTSTCYLYPCHKKASTSTHVLSPVSMPPTSRNAVLTPLADRGTGLALKGLRCFLESSGGVPFFLAINFCRSVA